MTINIKIKDEPIKTCENEGKELGKKEKEMMELVLTINILMIT